MAEKISITDAELDIMNVLWEKGSCTSQEIMHGLPHDEDRNRNTMKTLLLRLVNKGAVRYEEINSRTYKYFPIVTQSEYVSEESQSFMKKLFSGSPQKMLLNFVKEEQITKNDLQRLIDLIEDDEK